MPVGVQNLLRVRVCGAYMDEGPKFAKQGSFFSADFPQTRVGFPEIGKMQSKMGSFPPKFIIKVGVMAGFGNRRG